MRPRMLRPWSLGGPVAHPMGQAVPSYLLFWPILWEAWVPGRAPRVLEEEASMCRRSSPPSWYEPPFSSPLSPFLLTPVLLTFPLAFSSGSPFSAGCHPYSLLTLSLNDLASQGSPNSHPSEELLKQPDYSDKIKQMLGNPQGRPRGLGEEACSGIGGAGVLPLDGKTWEGKTGQREQCSATLV